LNETYNMPKHAFSFEWAVPGSFRPRVGLLARGNGAVSGLRRHANEQRDQVYILERVRYAARRQGSILALGDERGEIH
jgi:hypothetical protein